MTIDDELQRARQALDAVVIETPPFAGLVRRSRHRRVVVVAGSAVAVVLVVAVGVVSATVGGRSSSQHVVSAASMPPGPVVPWAPIPVPGSGPVLPPPFAALTYSTTAVPTRVRAGGVLAFVGVVSNPTGTPIVLDPCPSYEVTLTIGSHTVRATHLLNCDAAASSVPAHGSLRFHLQLATRSSSPRGVGILRWGESAEERRRSKAAGLAAIDHEIRADETQLTSIARAEQNLKSEITDAIGDPTRQTQLSQQFVERQAQDSTRVAEINARLEALDQQRLELSLDEFTGADGSPGSAYGASLDRQIDDLEQKLSVIDAAESNLKLAIVNASGDPALQQTLSSQFIDLQAKDASAEAAINDQLGALQSQAAVAAVDSIVGAASSPRSTADERTRALSQLQSRLARLNESEATLRAHVSAAAKDPALAQALRAQLVRLQQHDRPLRSDIERAVADLEAHRPLPSWPTPPTVRVVGS